MPETIELLVRNKSGRLLKVDVTIERVKGRIEFLDSPYALKDEIKAMQGSKWHGYDDSPRMIWSVKDTFRNHFQLEWLQGRNPYEWFERDIIEHHYDRPLRKHQRIMTDIMLTYHYGIIAAEMGLGKTLSAIECIERSGFTDWWWAAPKSGLAAVEREFKKWGISFLPKLMTYDRLRIEMEQWEDGCPAPKGIICDESSRLKGGDAKRTKAVQAVADAIRAVTP
jgi:SNF2 family DNA or RNA helicase